jgi:hypothetical protein
MPRFFFDTLTEYGLRLDDLGSEFGSAEDALADTRVSALQIAAGDLRANLPVRDSIIFVRDEQGETIGQVKVGP